MKKKISIPKKYSTLIVQFVFIFAAVFLSFLADDYREYLNTRAMERESLEGVYEDLKMDSLSIKRVIGVNMHIEKAGLKLLKMVDSGNIQADSAEVYFQSLLLGESYQSNKSHYEALKHSGSIQEIRNISLRNKLTDYYEQGINWISYFSDLLIGRYFTFVNDIKPFLKIRPGSKRLYEVKLTDKNYMLNDPLWQNSLGETVGLVRVRISALQALSEEVDRLRQMIRQELD